MIGSLSLVIEDGLVNSCPNKLPNTLLMVGSPVHTFQHLSSGKSILLKVKVNYGTVMQNLLHNVTRTVILQLGISKIPNVWNTWKIYPRLYNC